MKLVMVHGRAQGGKDPAALQKTWMDSFSTGLTRAKKKAPTKPVVAFPFYGDRLDSLVALMNTPLAADVLVKGASPDASDPLRGEILAEIAAGLGIADTDIAREFAGQPNEKGPLNWAWVHATFKAIDRVPGINSRMIDLFTRDVYLYLRFPAIRAQIDSEVDQSIGDGDCVVLAHSLGTVVAYNVLCKRPATTKCPRFVTVGSPLGIRAIKRHIERPLRVPDCVKNWFNAFDKRDGVALHPLDARNFPVKPAVENKSDVVNHTDNRHGIEGYLSDPVVAAKVAEFM